jgi:hypothetical protein
LLGRPIKFAESPCRPGGARMDVLSEVLKAVKLDGAIFHKAEYSAPWCFRAPASRTVAPYLSSDPRQAWVTNRSDGPAEDPTIHRIVMWKGTDFVLDRLSCAKYKLTDRSTLGTSWDRE